MYHTDLILMHFCIAGDSSKLSRQLVALTYLIHTPSLPCNKEQTPSTVTHCSLTFGWSRTGTTTLTVTLMGLSLVMSTMRRCSPPSPPLLAFDEPFKLFSPTLQPSAESKAILNDNALSYYDGYSRHHSGTNALLRAIKFGLDRG
jgi:hypothetical protein